MFKGEGNSKENPANYVVNDFKEAIELIFRLEGLNQWIIFWNYYKTTKYSYSFKN